jgi:large repetitive protein
MKLLRRKLLAAAFGVFTAAFAISACGGQCASITSPVIGIGGEVAFFAGLDRSGYSASIAWGDGTESAGNVSLNSPPPFGPPPPPPRFPPAPRFSFSVFGSHVYSSPLTATHIHVTFTGPGIYSSCESDAFDVVMPDSLSNPQWTLTEAPSGVQFSGVIAAFSDSNMSAIASDFTVWINWGDNTIGEGVVSGSAGAFSISGSHTYNVTGPLAASVAISEFAWPPPSYSPTLLKAAGTVVVGRVGSPPPPPPPGGDVLSDATMQLTSAHVEVPVTGVIATFKDSNPSAITSDFTAVINWGDGTQSEGVVSRSTHTFSVSAPPGGHTYTELGRVTVSVPLTEVANGTASSTASGTIRVE